RARRRREDPRRAELPPPSRPAEEARRAAQLPGTDLRVPRADGPRGPDDEQGAARRRRAEARGAAEPPPSRRGRPRAGRLERLGAPRALPRGTAARAEGRCPVSSRLDVGIAADLRPEGAFQAGPDDRFEEYDSPRTVEAIAAALQSLGHAPRFLGG